MHFAHTWRLLLNGSKIATTRIARMDEWIGYPNGQYYRVSEVNEPGRFLNFELAQVTTPSGRVKAEVGRDYPVMLGRGKPALWLDPDGQPVENRYDIWADLWNRCIVPDDWPNEKGPMPDWYGDAQLRALGYRPVRHVIDSIRLMRLQDMTEEDAKAEGCTGIWNPMDGWGFEGNNGLDNTLIQQSPLDEFMALWDTINPRKAHRAAANPWVFHYRTHVLIEEPIA